MDHKQSQPRLHLSSKSLPSSTQINPDKSNSIPVPHLFSSPYLYLFPKSFLFSSKDLVLPVSLTVITIHSLANNSTLIFSLYSPTFVSSYPVFLHSLSLLHVSLTRSVLSLSLPPSTPDFPPFRFSAQAPPHTTSAPLSA